MRDRAIACFPEKLAPRRRVGGAVQGSISFALRSRPAQLDLGSRGFSLIEVTIALGLVGLCILVLVGSLASGINTDHDSFTQTISTDLAGALVADLHAPASTQTSGNSSTATIGFPTIYGTSTSGVATKSSRFSLAYPQSKGSPSTSYVWFNTSGVWLASGTSASAPADAVYRATVVITQVNEVTHLDQAQIFITSPANHDEPKTGQVYPTTNSLYEVVTYFQQP